VLINFDRCKFLFLPSSRTAGGRKRIPQHSANELQRSIVLRCFFYRFSLATVEACVK